VFLRLTVDGLSFVEEGLGGTLLSTTTKGLFQFDARTSARENCRIRVKTHVLIAAWHGLAILWHDLGPASASLLIQGSATLAEVAHQLGRVLGVRC
jgi:hypothetical protein